MNKNLKKLMILALCAAMFVSSMPIAAIADTPSNSVFENEYEDPSNDIEGEIPQDIDDAEGEPAILLPDIGNNDQSSDDENNEGDNRDLEWYVLESNEQEPEEDDRDISADMIGTEEESSESDSISSNIVDTDEEEKESSDDDREIYAVDIFNAPGSRYIYRGVKAGFRVRAKTTFIITTSPAYSVQIGTSGKVYYNGDKITLNPNSGTNYYSVTASGNCTFRLSVYTAPTVDIFMVE